MFSTKWKQHPYLRSGTKRCHGGLTQRGTACADTGGSTKHLYSDIRGLSLTHPLRSMARQCMSHLMSQHCSESCFGLGYGKYSGVHGALAARKRKGVHRLVIFDHRHFPPVSYTHLT